MSTATRRDPRVRAFRFLLAALIVLAWLALWVWGRSPYSGYLRHDDLDSLIYTHGLTVPLFIVGWTVMTLAMMLPTSVPLVVMFQTLTRRRPDNATLVSLLVLGYLLVWVGFGILAEAGDLQLHRLVDSWPWLDDHAWLIAVGVLTTAGAYQFSRLKYRCLAQCRSPYSFIVEHWRGSDERRHALRLGVRHGLFCLGCCWSLMLMLFALGVGNLGWMLGLGVVMATEKNVKWGRRISRPLGAGLLIWAAALATVSIA